MDASEKKTAREFLRRCDSIYEALVKHVLDLEARGDDEETLKWISLTAGVAWAAHTGRFADGRLEAVALRLGRKLDEAGRQGTGANTSSLRARETAAPRRVLHVATTVLEYGGHTPLISNWIKNDNNSVHSLLLINQRQQIPQGLARRISESGGTLTVLPVGLPLLEKARLLRQAAQSGLSCVVLHHHPNDVVPLVALASEQCPPVAVMNHADHVFWLGSSIADVVIDFRDFGAQISQRRFAKRSLLLPLPLDFTTPPVDRAEARRRLNLTDGEVMLLSIGTTYKYTPTKTHNFLRTMHKVLTRNPTAQLYVIGIGAGSARLLKEQKHERMHLLGVINNLVEYELAADLYLEGFPYGSYTALLETVAHGICPILMYAPTPQADNSGSAGLKGLVTNAADEEEYLKQVTALINALAERAQIGRAVKQQVPSAHGGDAWRAYLQAIYQYLDATTHQPALIPPTECAETEADLNLAAFNRARIKTALLQQVTDNTFASLTFSDLIRMLFMSLRIGDTRLSPFQFKVWLGLLKSKALNGLRQRRALRALATRL